MERRKHEVLSIPPHSTLSATYDCCGKAMRVLRVQEMNTMNMVSLSRILCLYCHAHFPWIETSCSANVTYSMI